MTEKTCFINRRGWDVLDGLKETVLDKEASDGKCWNAQIKSTSTPSAKVRHRYRLRASCCAMERCWRKHKNKNSRTSCLKQGSGCISRNVLLTNYTFPSFILYDNNIFVSCTTVKHDWRWANKQITQNNATAFWKMLIILLLNNHSDVAGWQLTSQILEKSVLATPHVCTFCLNGTTLLWEGLCVVIVFSRS